MIKKWIYKLRYILIIFSALLWILGLSSSFGLELSYWYDSNNNYYATWDVVYVYNRQWNDIEITQEGNFITNTTYNWLQFWNDQYNWNWIFFWSGWDIYAFVQWKLSRNLGWCYNTTPWISPQSCWNYSDTIESMVEINDWIAFNWFWIASPWYVNIAYWSTYDPAYICFYNNHSYCVMLQSPENATATINSNPCNNWTYWCSISSYVSDLNGYSSFWIWGWIWDIAWGWLDISNDMVIKNYEDMGWNKSICYAWEWSGWQLISAPWTWFSIFDLYSTYNPLWFSTITEWYDYYRYWFQDNPNIATTWSVFAWDWVFHAPLHSLFAMWYKNGVWVLFPSADIIQHLIKKFFTIRNLMLLM